MSNDKSAWMPKLERHILYYLLSILLGWSLVSCSSQSPSEKFISSLTTDMLESDRSDVLCQHNGIDSVSYADDMHYETEVKGNDVQITMTGSFNGTVDKKRGQYRYSIKEHYILLDEKNYRFEADTSYIYTGVKETSKIIYPNHSLIKE